MNSKTCSITTAVLALAGTMAHGQSAWLPAPLEVKTTPGFSFSTFDEFWMGDSKVDNPPNGDSLDQYTAYLSLEFGILERLAADATVGYTWTDSDAFGGQVSDDGLTDTSLGLRYRLIDEFTALSEYAPTVSIRAGAVIAGTYDDNLPFSAGDGAHAFESSLLLGKIIGQTGFGGFGQIGYRVRENPVPDDVFGNVGVFKQFGPVNIAVGYRHVQAVSGLDIGGSGFNPALGRSHGFPALKEINQLVEAGLSFTDNGGRNYQISAAKSVDGRNTGDKWLFGANITIPWGGQ